MATRVRDTLFEHIGELRVEPIEKRIRATLGDTVVLDTTRAVLVWEPRRIVPTYAVPEPDLRATVAPSDVPRGTSERPILDPSVPFSVHTTDGELLDLTVDGQLLPAVAFRATDSGLAGSLVLDFDAFTAWYEEEERNLGHPRDPYHRVEILRSSRHVVVARDGVTLAESRSPMLLFESLLPARFYLPPEDVVTAALGESDTTSVCAYKGIAAYRALPTGEDVAWVYPQPQREAVDIAGRFCFFNERVDLTVDGVRLERPVTPWS